MKYYVYILRCSDNTLYTGITTDLERRVREHNGEGGVGAKYTKARQPVCLVYQAEFLGRSESSKEEMRIKKMTRKEKNDLIDKTMIK